MHCRTQGLGGCEHTPLLAVADPFADNQEQLNSKIRKVCSRDIWFKTRGQQYGVGRDTREGEEQDALYEGDEGGIKNEKDKGRDFGLDDFPITRLAP